MKNKRQNKYLKIYYSIMTLVFLVILIVIVTLNTTKKDIKFSESENRILAQKPKFSIERLLEGRYTKKYEKYKVDQFVDRDGWMKLKSGVVLALGKNESNGIYKGSDDYLIESFEEPDSEIVNRNIKAINNFNEKHKDIKEYMLISPNSVSILSEKLPPYAPVVSQKLVMDNFAKTLNKGINYIDVYNTLDKHDKEYIYYKTDHHWTTLGAYYSFLEAAKAMDLEVKKDYYNVERVSNDFYGTLYSKSGYEVKTPDYIDVYLPKDENDEYVVNYVEEQKKSASFYDSEKLETKDKYGMFLGGNHPVVKIKTTSKEDRKLLIFKDSYANSFVPFLTQYFSDIIMVDPRYYYDDIEKLIQEEGISDILYLYNANTFFSDTSLELVLNNQ